MSDCSAFISIVCEVCRICEMFIEGVSYVFVGGDGMIVEFD